MITALAGADESLNDLNRSTLPHVLLVLDQFPKTLGGGERIVLRLAALLPKYGYRVSILTFFVHPECTGITSPHCPVYVLPLTRTFDISAFRAALELRRFLKKQRVQIVQTFFESSDLWAGSVAKISSDAKLIWSRRDMGILRARKHQIAYRLLAGTPDAVFAVSEQVRSHCIEIDHIEPTCVHVIHNGLDLADFDAGKHVKDPDALLVTTVGNIRRVKGHDVLIKAAARVRSQFPGVSFSVAGEVLEQDYFAELQTLVRDLNLTDHFHFIGGVADTKEHLSKADIFVLPSRSEGFSNAIIEAMAASLPVVATDVGGNAEAVKNGVTGFIVPSEDPEALATALMQLISSPQQAMAMGIAGKSFAAESFTTEAMMGRIVATYRHLLGQP